MRSAKFTPAARTRMRTSPARSSGCGLLRSSKARPGGPFRTMKTCLIGRLLRRPLAAWQAPSMRSVRLAAVLGAVAAACAGTAPRPSNTVQRDLPLAAQARGKAGSFDLRYCSDDREEIERLRSALLVAATPLSRWGTFEHPVAIRLYPDHQSLEAAVQREGYPWLRAWAFADRIFLQSPRSWNDPSPATVVAELRELLAHELTHALMYQLLGGAPEPPLWFREGMASVTAGQGHRRPTAEELSRWIAAHPGEDLLEPAPDVYRTEKEAVYGAAHRAFELFLTMAGDDGVRELLLLARGGRLCQDAFSTLTGVSAARFEKDSA